MTEAGRKYLLYFCTAAFVFAIAISYLIGKMTVSDKVFAPVSPDFSAVSPMYAILSVLRSCKGTAMQLFLIYLAGFSAFAFPVTAAVCAYRGISFGYTCSLVTSDRLLMDRTLLLPTHGLVFTMYLLSTASVLFFARDSVEGRREMSSTYTKRLFIVAGVTSVLDIIRGFIV